jgi:hypothetical protein
MAFLDSEQMIIILDALESVTNGMENPGLLEQIKDIPRESKLRPYVDLVFALQAYYGQNPTRVREYLTSIPDDSPPARLKPLLFYLAGLAKDPPEGRVDREILKALQQRKSYLETALEEAEQFLRENHEDSFSDSIAYLIRELYAKFPEASKQLTLWAWEKIQENGWDGSLLDAHLKMIFGDLEATRLKALYSLHAGLPEAWEEWTSFLMKLLHTEPRNEKTVEASLMIWIYAAIQVQMDAQRVQEVLEVLERKYPQVKAKYEKALEEQTARGTDVFVNTVNPPFSSPRRCASPSRKKRDFVQLELFPS